MGRAQSPHAPTERSALTDAGLGPLEARVLEMLWLHSSATVAELVKDLRDGGHRSAYTTILTVVSRLHQRGLLQRVAEGRRHRYSPALSQAEFLSMASDAAVGRVLDRFGSAALRQFAIRIADLDPSARQELIELANAHPAEKSRGDIGT